MEPDKQGTEPRESEIKPDKEMSNSEATAQPAEPNAPPVDDVPQNHALPAAYKMWKDLSRRMNERASQWEEEEFQFRMERAAIIYEIQVERMHKALLEAALDEIYRHEELLEHERMLQRQLVP